MIDNMCEINRKKIIFGHQFVKAIHHLILHSGSRVECSIKCVMIGVREFIKLVSVEGPDFKNIFIL